MRLIDADKLMDSLRGNVLIDVTTELEKTIAEQQTAFDKEKVIEELKSPYNYAIMAGKHVTTVDRSVEIVENGGIE